MMHVRTICRGCAILVLTLLVATSMAVKAKGKKESPPAPPSIMDQLDIASAHFHSAQADVQYDTYTRAAREHDIEKGFVYVERTGKSTSMGAIVFAQGAKTPSKVVNYTGGVLQLYAPGEKQIDIFKAAANQAKYESFLTLGFGGSGQDLQREWVVQDQGAETIDGIKTEKLDLVSKEQSVKNMYSHVTIWVDPVRGVSLKQVFFQPEGDSRTAVYTNIQLNGTINKKPYAIDPKATKVQH